MTVRPTGLQGGMNYLGVEAPTPPNSVQVARAPTAKDYNNFQLGDFWLNTLTQDVWVLVSKAQKVATWVRFSTGAAGTLDTLTGSDASVATPVANNVTFPNAIIPASGNLAGNIISHGTLGNLTLNLTNTITVPGSVISASGPTGTITDATYVALNGGVGFNANILLDNNTLTALGPRVRFLKSRNNGIVVNADDTGEIDFFGYDGAQYIQTAQILGQVAPGAVGLNQVPGNLQFLTTGTAAFAVPTLRMIIGQNGAVRVSATDDGSASFIVLGNGMTTTGPVTMNGGTIDIATDATDNAVNIGTLANAGRTTIVGNATGTSILALRCGTGGATLGISATDHTVQIGSTTGVSTMTLNSGTGGIIANGVAGVTVANSAAVLIDTVGGQLGTIASSIKHKENILNMGNESNPIMYLNPVVFNYKKDAQKHKQYGLIAEEVAEILPNLVNFDESLDPTGVRYHDLPVLLLNELQKLNKRVKDLEDSVIPFGAMPV